MTPKQFTQDLKNAYYSRDHDLHERLCKRVEGLYEAIAHGDEGHRQWLREAIANVFAGKPVPPAQ